MKKYCSECKQLFFRETRGFDDVRLTGICPGCRKKREDAAAILSDLKDKRAKDLKLEELSNRISDAVEACVTSGPQQVSLITIIRFGPCTVGEVAQAVGLDQSSITLHLRKFESEGFVTVTSGGDKRQKFIRATQKAHDLYSRKDQKP